MNQRNDYVPEGEHVLKHKSIKQDTAFEGYKFILAELEVVETDNAKLKPGQMLSFFVKIQNGTPWEANLKAYLGAVMGYEDANDVDEEDCETALASDNPLLDTLVRVTGKDRPQKKDKTKSFTNLNWRPYEEADATE